MILKVSCLLLISLAYLLMQTCEGQRYWRAFQHKHIHCPKTQIDNPSAYCNEIMKQKGLDISKCRRLHIFINDSISNVQAICSSGGTTAYWRNRYYDSRNHFNVVQCTAISGSSDDCRYRGIQLSSRLQVACIHNTPYHFMKLLP